MPVALHIIILCTGFRIHCLAYAYAKTALGLAELMINKEDGNDDDDDDHDDNYKNNAQSNS